jgi:hypothetical protein
MDPQVSPRLLQRRRLRETGLRSQYNHGNQRLELPGGRGSEPQSAGDLQKL